MEYFEKIDSEDEEEPTQVFKIPNFVEVKKKAFDFLIKENELTPNFLNNAFGFKNSAWRFSGSKGSNFDDTLHYLTSFHNNAWFEEELNKME